MQKLQESESICSWIVHKCRYLRDFSNRKTDHICHIDSFNVIFLLLSVCTYMQTNPAMFDVKSSSGSLAKLMERRACFKRGPG